MNALKFHTLPNEFAVCQLPAGEEVPQWAQAGEGSFVSVTRCEDEISIVIESGSVPENVNCERGWRCLRLAGPFDFDQIGIIAGFTAVLAKEEIGVFVISTFNTDYVLVKSSEFQRAQEILSENGYEFLR